MRAIAWLLGVCLVCFGSLFAVFAALGYFTGTRTASPIGEVVGFGLTGLILIAWGSRLMTGSQRPVSSSAHTSSAKVETCPHELKKRERIMLWISGLMISLLGVGFGAFGVYLIYVWRDQWWYGAACVPASAVLLSMGYWFREAALWSEERQREQFIAALVKFIFSNDQ